MDSHTFHKVGDDNLGAMNQESISITSVTTRLRAIRKSKGLSLLDVEELSRGRIKAVVLGSYERGTRSMSVRKALEIADVLQVPVTSFFSDKSHAASGNTEPAYPKQLILDLRSISKRLVSTTSELAEPYQLLALFTRSIVHTRQDWNGELISIRGSDIAVLSKMLNFDESTFIAWLDRERILLRKRGHSNSDAVLN